MGANARTLRAGLEAKAFIKTRIIVAHVSLGAIFSFVLALARDGRCDDALGGAFRVTIEIHVNHTNI